MTSIIDAYYGIRRFSGDIDDCRAFLRELGLEYPRSGPIWLGWHKHRWQGAIYFADGSYHAAAWRTAECYCARCREARR